MRSATGRAAPRITVLLVGVGLLGAALTGTSFGAEPAPTIVVAHLDGAVDPVSAGYLHRVVGAAEQEHAALLVLTIDTPGGLDSSMREIVQDLLAAHLPSVVFVSPSGARAASAGVFIAQAANLVAMAPGTNIGAAHPVGSGGETIAGDLGDKIINDAAAYIGSLAKQHGRNDSWVQDAVRSSASLGAQEAVDQHVADLLAPDLNTLLAAVDGRTVRTAAGETTIHTPGASIEVLSMQPAELVLQKAFDPNVAYLLLTIGFYALLIELFHPGALLPGVTGVVCLVLAFAASAVLPLNWGGAVLILLAVALFILDVKAAAHGALTAAGLVAFVMGSLLLYSPPGPRSPTLPDVAVATPLLVAMAAATALLSVLIVGVAVRLAARPALTAIDTLIGADGIAQSALGPDGTVQVAGQLWSAHTAGAALPAGERVRVIARRGLTLEVETEASKRVQMHKEGTP
ncbi:MAG: nodulation protein NfeD [Chloroflexota bacterium]|nr:nodulation protein NfeD [Chloroflexota bacterium]